jgi:cell fate regulator YaaT (PSP1 superfamily)
MSDSEDRIPNGEQGSVVEEAVAEEAVAEVEAACGAAPAGAAVTSEPSGAAATLARVKVLYSSATELCTVPPGMTVQTGDLVVVPTRYGNEVARVLRLCEGSPGGEARPIARVASPMDLSRLRENGVREEKAYATCRQRVEAHGLDMKLVSAHYLLDDQKILFLFTADTRVDFRELVRDLVATFRMRIELRQIGVRDEARVVGGVGTCGRVLCCNGVTDRLRPVSIKMAKEQNLTLNSLKISGHCGRLLCCLSYEFDAYHEARQSLPGVGARVGYDGEEFKVSDLNVLARRARLEAPSGRVLDVGFEAFVRVPRRAGPDGRPGGGSGTWELRLRGGASAANGEAAPREAGPVK